MLEEERKYLVGVGFTMPDLSGCAPAGGGVLPQPARTLRATYYDTEDHRLARSGVSLRHRRGEAAAKAWTVKLPSDAPGTRHEISRPGPPGTIPAELVSLLTVYHRGAQLRPSAVLRTVRRAYEIRGAGGEPLAEVADDTVSVLDGRRVRLKFREVEVERQSGGTGLLDRVETALLPAGAELGDFVPKHLRAMGDAATAPPDLHAPGRLPRAPSAADVVAAALRHDIARIIRYDPFVRLREQIPGGDAPIHQMRVGCRRLCSDLGTFRPLLRREWVDGLRDELGWIAGLLGAAGDAEVLRSRLHRTAAADPLAPLDGAAVARLDADLAARHEEALVVLDDALECGRYTALLDRLIDAARDPQVDDGADAPARRALPPLVARAWRMLVTGRPGQETAGDTGRVGAGSLSADAPDDHWHEVRVLGKQARYAAEAVAGVLGGAASELAAALAALQDLLGEHRDATVAGETWLAIAASDPDDHALAVTAGRLYERERSAVRNSRCGFEALWHAVDRQRITGWLR